MLTIQDVRGATNLWRVRPSHSSIIDGDTATSDQREEVIEYSAIASFAGSGENTATGFNYSLYAGPGVTPTTDFTAYWSPRADFRCLSRLERFTTESWGPDYMVLLREGATVETGDAGAIMFDGARGDFEAGAVRLGVTSRFNETLVNMNGEHDYEPNCLAPAIDPRDDVPVSPVHTMEDLTIHHHSPFLRRIADGTFCLYYSAFIGGRWGIYYRTSRDGLTGWSARQHTGIDASPPGRMIRGISVIRLLNERYRIYYARQHPLIAGVWQIVYRESANGLTGWTPEALTLIDSRDPFVMSIGPHRFRIYYRRERDRRLYLGESEDGVSWGPPRPVGNWPNTESPHPIRLAGGWIRLYFAQRDADGFFRVRYSESPNGVDGWTAPRLAVFGANVSQPFIYRVPERTYLLYHSQLVGTLWRVICRTVRSTDISSTFISRTFSSPAPRALDLIAVATDGMMQVTVSHRSADTPAGLAVAPWSILPFWRGGRLATYRPDTSLVFNRLHQYRITANTGIEAAWCVRGVVLVPRITTYGRFIATPVVGRPPLERNRFFQWLALGGDTGWAVRRARLVSFRGFLDLGVVCKLKSITPRDTEAWFSVMLSTDEVAEPAGITTYTCHTTTLPVPARSRWIIVNHGERLQEIEVQIDSAKTNNLYTVMDKTDTELRWNVERYETKIVDVEPGTVGEVTEFRVQAGPKRITSWGIWLMTGEALEASFDNSNWVPTPTFRLGMRGTEIREGTYAPFYVRARVPAGAPLGERVCEVGIHCEVDE